MTGTTALKKRKAGRQATAARKKTDRRLPTAAPHEHGWLIVRGARHNNLKNIDVEIPLGRFVCVTGVSGSGKSSLVNDIVREQLTATLNGAEKVRPGDHDAILGTDRLDKIIDIDQSPIGRTPRSNPATYIKLFDEIRGLFAKLPDSQVRGYAPGRFSFNVPTGKGGGGRCEACEGNGSNRIEMDFLADVWVECPLCEGRRFNHETVQVLYKGKSIADVLNMDVQEALEHFDAIPKIRAMLSTLHDVGLDYLKLGQSSTTLSGGEAQRIKLARELVKRSTGGTLYLLDEPTTGLHFDDIRRLLAVLHGFVDAGNSVICIEHNLDVIKTADWVVDLGPEGGDGGGRVVVAGTPEAVSECRKSHTGRVLRDVLTPRRQSPSRSSKQKLGGKRKKTGRRTDDAIQVVGAREHNLKDITVRIPRGAMTVCSGVSGSGKSSLAIDTVYTEGQRRYVESLSAYARQFLGQLQKPKVDHVYGLSPAVAIEQKAATKSPRSTVGTVTEIYDYMRVLWARVGQPYCPRCDIPIGTQSSEEIADSVASMPDGTKLLLCAPIERGPGESWDALFARCRANGYTRIRIDANVCELSQELSIDARRRHDVELVVDRVAVRSAAVRRIGDSVEQCLAVGDGVMVAVDSDSGAAKRFSQHFSCDSCQTSYDELTPHHFSFNARMGWCKHCEGLGVQRGTGVESVVIQPHLSILGGAIAGWENVEKQPMLRAMLEALANAIGFKPKAPLNTLTDAQRHVLLFGLGDRWVEAKGKAAIGLRFQWKGFFPTIDEATKMSWRYRTKLEHLVTDVPCTRCSGGRIRPEATAVRVGDRSIVQVCAMLLRDSAAFFRELRLDKRRTRVAGELLHEIKSRLQFLVDVGLDYLSLDRQAPTLSGGESQRIRLASQIGSGLTGVLYVLDEPTIGLHPRDNKRLIAALHKLRDLGNTLLLVEHDREVIESSDHVIDFGPGAGAHGGHVVGAGSPRGIRRQRRSLTGRYLAGKAAIGVPTNRRPVQWLDGADDDASPPALTVMGARHNNLDSIDVSFPIGRFNCITGVSGSGKSSLVSEVLYPALAARIHRARLTPGAHQEIRGADHIDKVISVDQQPIGNSPSSNAATYTGVFDVIRELFAKLSDSKIRGYTANRFSFNRAGGRCDDCNGLGQVCHEMHFLPDVWVPCESCGGSRYNRETLQVRYKSKSIADVLAMPASEAVEHFANVPKVRRMLKTIEDVGLGYLQLGQAAPTLSGGEAQRVKLAAELGRPNTGKTLYILDEPTTGLHFEDLRKLLDVLHRLVDLGNTVLCIEHNLDVIKTADWIVDLGPEAGRDGGRIVAAGAPEDVAKVPESHTGRLLAAVLKTGPRVQRERFDAKAAAAKAAREEKLAAPEIESGVRMPWERNGRKWHTGDRVSRDGQKIEWEGRALAFVVDLIEKQGGKKLLPTVWNDRARVEINARAPDGLSQSSAPWFFHARTGARWLLDFSFRVPRSTFTGPALKKRLKLKTLDEREDIPAYGSEPRVRVRRAGEMDDVRVQVYDKKEVSTTAFRTFVSTALKSHVQHLSRLAGDAAMATPWKVDGRAWHLSQKSIRGRESKEWKPIVLMELIGKLNRIAPTMKADWSRKITVSLQNANGASIGMIVTNNRYGLRVILRTPAGRFTPTMIEHLGLYPEVKTAKGTGQVSFWVQTLDQVHGPTLKAVVTAAVEPR